MDYFVHESSYVDDNVRIGKHTKIWHFCHVMPNVDIGQNCIIGQNVFIGSNVKIGHNVKIQNNVSLYDGVIVEDDVFIGPSAVFTNVINPRSFIERKDAFRPTTLKKGSSIGANSTIICGNTIGQYALVGAGATVTKSIDDFKLVVGTPAKFKSWICRCGENLKIKNGQQEIICTACSTAYRMENNKLNIKE